MSASKRMKVTVFAGAGITIAGIVLRYSAEWILTRQRGPGWTSVDEAARDQLHQDARLVFVFGVSLMLLACHRWLWSTDTEADVENN
ncbi:MAG: hypothetical protein RIK87_16195 [Fuerstiella sp.]